MVGTTETVLGIGEEMTLTRSKLEEYIGENVEVTLFNGDVIQGYLRKTGTEELKNEPGLYLKRGCYFLSGKDVYDYRSCLFRVSHIKKIKHCINIERRI